MMTNRTIGWIAGLIVLLGSGPLGWNKNRAALADEPPTTPNQRIRGEKKERRKIALVATAHYLLRCMFAMLRSGEVWHEAA